MMTASVNPETTLIDPSAECCGQTTEAGCCGGTARETMNQTEGTTQRFTNAQLQTMRSGTVYLAQSSAERIEANHVELERSGAQNITTELAQLRDSGAVRIESKRAILQGGSAVGVVAEDARFVRSRVLFSAARNAQMDAETRVLLHVGPTTPCAQSTFTTGSAVGLGAGLGLAFFLLGRLFGRRR